jgi:hypothetical protein
MTVSDLLKQPCSKCDNAINLVTSHEQLVKKLIHIIRLVPKLFQQVRYSHDITILLIQPCVINLVTFLLNNMAVSDLLEQLCNKSDNAIKLVTSF